MAITSPNAQTFLSVQNALLKDTITMWTPAITLFTVPNHSSSSRDCPRWKDEKEILSLKYKHNLSFIEARREVENRRKDQLQSSGRQSYSNAVSPTPAKDSCPTCELLAKKLLEKFPDMANELKDLIPSKVLSPSSSSQKPTPQSKAPSSDTSKSS